MSTTAIEAIVGLSPLHIFIWKCAARNALKMQILSNKEYSDFGHMSILRKIPDKDISCSVTDYMIPKRVFNRNYEIIISDRDEWEIGGPWVNPKSLIWFTDGSKTNTGVGAGIFGPNTKISEPMGKWPSVFQAEIQAISICALTNLKRGIKGAHITIYSDSQAALKALMSHSLESRLVEECVNNLQKLCTKNTVVLCWVPGHSGIEGNEIADELARAGSTSDLIGPEPYCGINWAEAKSRVDQWEHTLRIAYWEDNLKLRQAKRLVRPFTYKKELINLRKVDIRKIVGFLTGHYYLNYHLNRIQLLRDTECRLCFEDDETTEHLLCECVALARTRMQIFHRDQLDPEEIKKAPITDILRFIRIAEKLLEEHGFQPTPFQRQRTTRQTRT